LSECRGRNRRQRDQGKRRGSKFVHLVPREFSKTEKPKKPAGSNSGGLLLLVSDFVAFYFQSAGLRARANFRRGEHRGKRLAGLLGGVPDGLIGGLQLCAMSIPRGFRLFRQR
jgi:hypothetical protein